MRKVLTVTLLCLGLVLLSRQPVKAATVVQNGLSVSPATQTVAVAPGQSTVTFNTLVSNNTNSPIVVDVSARDFTTLDQTGNLSFFNVSSLDTNSPHGLATSLTLGFTEVALGVGQSQIVPVTINAADKLALGGHYSAIIFRQAGGAGQLGNKVVVRQEVASLVFVTTAGGGTQATDLIDVLQSIFTTHIPKRVPLVIANSGNTQTIPRGFIEVDGSAGHLVSKTVLNADSSLILPNSKRLFTLDLPVQKGHNWPGLYHLKVVYRPDGDTNYQTYQKTFLLINLWIFVLLVLAISVGVLWISWHILPKTFYRLYKR